MPLKDLTELVHAGIISAETEARIRDYYQNKEGVSSQSKLYIVTGILGAILVGLGIILIIAHNWDELSRSSKTIFAFLPLVVGQLLCGFTLVKKENITAWKESASAFLFFAVASSISLVAQIYNIPGDTSTFLLTWMLLCLPLVYIMRSSVVALLYIVGITYYAGVTNYFTYGSSGTWYYYWILLLLVLPYYYWLYRKRPGSNSMTLLNWFIPLSLVISLGTVGKSNGELLFVAYISLFGLFYLIGNTSYFRNQRPAAQGYTTIGTLGTISVLMSLSFDWIWSNLRTEHYNFPQVLASPEFIAALVLTLCAAILFYRQKKNSSWNNIRPVEPVFIVFIFIFMIGLVSPVAVVLINLLVLAIGLMIMRNGARINHLGVLNFGLFIIAILVLCRFFDTDLSFVIRGLLFVGVGIGFFVANLRLIKKRKTNA